MGTHTGGTVLAKANKQKQRAHEVMGGRGGSGRSYREKSGMLQNLPQYHQSTLHDILNKIFLKEKVMYL